MVIFAVAAGSAGAVDDGLAGDADDPGVELAALVVDEAAAGGVDALCPAPTD